MKRLLSPIPMIVLAGVLALVALLAYGLASNNTSESSTGTLINKVAPTPQLPTLDGPGKSSLAAYRGKVVLVNYWASWCDPCRSEAPLLERWQRQIAPNRATVIGVDVLDVSSDANDFIRRFGLTYPQVRDADGSKLGSFDVSGYPETVLIDRSGKIAAHYRGPVNQQFFVEQVKPLLRERA